MFGTSKRLNKAAGCQGEFSADEYLRGKGYKILARNYQNKIGEIDIIAEKNSEIVFVEVKHRSTLAFGRPAEAVTPQKQYKIRRTAEFWLVKYKKMDFACRFDVIEVLDGQINHIENAF